MKILGISAFYHDSAAALVIDGKIVAAAQEERFTRKKHDESFPTNSIKFCLEHSDITLSDIDFVAFYEKPFLKFERLLETYLAFVPFGFNSFRRAIPIWTKQKLFLPIEISNSLKEIPGKYNRPFVFPEHHESHAASAFFPSQFDEAAIITTDGVGEWTTTSLGFGKGNKIELLWEQRFPHSLGLLYSAFTYYAGFTVNSGEYKLMGLAPYGEPKYQDIIEKHLIDIKEDGSYWMDMSYFTYCQGVRMTGKKFAKLFGKPRRKPESELTQFYMDIAASIQKTTEKCVLAMASHVKKITGSHNLCLSGGVALNCVANGNILREAGFENIWIQPAAGDAGGALGTALFVWYELLNNKRETSKIDSQFGTYLGPQYNDDEIQKFLESKQANCKVYKSDDETCEKVTDLLANEKVVGWFQGRMEFGPRALGARSILGDARSTNMQKTLNLKIKFRESFRPFAPSVARDRVADYFEMRENEDSPYMLLVAQVNKSQIMADLRKIDKTKGLEKLHVSRSKIQAVTHVDCSARVQTVDAKRNPKYYKLIKSFEKITGCPVLINTSFNVRGEPIVCSLDDAYRCFLATNMDILVLGNCVLKKEKQANAVKVNVAEHLKQFALD